MTYYTYNNIIDLLNLYARGSTQIKRFGAGSISDIDSMINQAQTFPIMWANLIDVTAPTLNTKNYNFNLLVFDTLNPNKENEQEVWSDCLSICEDIVRFLYWAQSKNYNIILPVKFTTFTERFTDFVAGANLNITIQVDADLQNSCGIAGSINELQNLPPVIN